MPVISLAPALSRWLTAEGTGPGCSVQVHGATLREALEALFLLHPILRSYVLDERGTMRHHVVAFVDGVAVADKLRMGLMLEEKSEVFLFQALSGG